MRILTAIVGTLLVAGCTTERIVLLPSQDGRQSAVLLRSGDTEHRLDSPYATVARQGGNLNAYTSTPEAVAKRVGPALASQPARPRNFTLNFKTGSDELTEESLADFDKIKSEIKAHAAPEVLVIGHTDRVGSLQANDELSLKRAQTVRNALAEAGIPEAIIEVSGRGEREPLVPTADEVDEPRNRRVEISVR